MRVLTHAKLDLGRWRWHAIVLSLVIVVAGIVTVATRGLALGIDFSGGTAVIVEFERDGATSDGVRDALAALAGDAVVQQYRSASERRFLIRVATAPRPGQNDSLAADVTQVRRALEASSLPQFAVVDRDLVSAAIGGDLQRRGLYAVIASIAAITVYLGVRFRLSFAVGGIAATLHDLLVTLAFLAFAGYDLTLNVTAALLTIVGYSVNDTIVIFDRVRENRALMRREPLDAVVNVSVGQTMSRTVLTAGTTFLAVLALYLFGGESLEGFAFTMLVGIVSGTYSTVFIASAIAVLLSRRNT